MSTCGSGTDRVRAAMRHQRGPRLCGERLRSRRGRGRGRLCPSWAGLGSPRRRHRPGAASNGSSNHRTRCGEQAAGKAPQQQACGKAWALLELRGAGDRRALQGAASARHVGAAQIRADSGPPMRGRKAPCTSRGERCHKGGGATHKAQLEPELLQYEPRLYISRLIVRQSCSKTEHIYIYI